LIELRSMYSPWTSRSGAVEDFNGPPGIRAKTKGSARNQRESRKGPRAIRSGTSTRAFCTEAVRGSRRTARVCREPAHGRETLPGELPNGAAWSVGNEVFFRHQLLGHVGRNLGRSRNASCKLSGRARGWLRAVRCPAGGGISWVRAEARWRALDGKTPKSQL